VRPDPPDLLAPLGLLVRPDPPDPPDLLAPLGLRVGPDPPAPPALLGLQARPDLLDLPDRQGSVGSNGW
jgi:hypothetical protein